MKGILNRNVTVEECPWLSQDLPKDKVVYKYLNYTYGCIGDNGVAVSDVEGDGPFYEVPALAVDWVNSK